MTEFEQTYINKLERTRMIPLVATLTRDLKFVRRLVNGWRLSSEITNWTRVEELLRESRGSRPSSSLARP